MCECITSKNNLILICSKALNAEVVAPLTMHDHVDTVFFFVDIFRLFVHSCPHLISKHVYDLLLFFLWVYFVFVFFLKNCLNVFINKFVFPCSLWFALYVFVLYSKQDRQQVEYGQSPQSNLFGKSNHKICLQLFDRHTHTSVHTGWLSFFKFTLSLRQRKSKIWKHKK